MGKKFDVKPGDVFGRLVVVKELPSQRSGNQSRRMVLCRCSCGKEKEIRLSHLYNHKIVSCGCYAREVKSLTHKKYNDYIFNNNIVTGYTSSGKSFPAQSNPFRRN